MHELTDLWHYLTSIPLDTWTQILDYIAASGLVALVLQVIKRKLGIDSKHIILALLSGMSLLASASDYLITNNPAPPLAGIGSVWAYVLALAVIIHRFAVSPAFKALQTWLENRSKPVVATPVVTPSQTPQGFAE